MNIKLQRNLCPKVPLYRKGFPGGLDGKPAMQESQVQSLGWEDPLEKEMATHSDILAGKIPWTEEPGGLRSMGLRTVRHTSLLSRHTV